MCFLFLVLDAKIPKFTYVKFETKTVDLNMYKTGHSKLSNTVVLCYLAFNAFHAGFLSEINLVLVKMIILNDIL